jgi:hypothetical protein
VIVQPESVMTSDGTALVSDYYRVCSDAVLRRCCDAFEVCSDAHARVYVQSETFLNLLMTRSAVTHMRVRLQSVTALVTGGHQ